MNSGLKPNRQRAGSTTTRAASIKQSCRPILARCRLRLSPDCSLLHHQCSAFPFSTYFARQGRPRFRPGSTDGNLLCLTATLNPIHCRYGGVNRERQPQTTLPRKRVGQEGCRLRVIGECKRSDERVAECCCRFLGGRERG